MAAPTASITASATTVDGGAVVRLTGTATDAEDTLAALKFQWAATGGELAAPTLLDTRWTAPPATPDAQSITVTLTVIDTDGETGTASVTIAVNRAPAVAEKIDADSIAALLVSQWDDAPRMKALLREVLGVVKEQLVEPLAYLERSIKTSEAEGVWIDYIGDRVDCVRPNVLDTSFEYFGFDESSDDATAAAGDASFDQGPFASVNPALAARVGVGDAYYRQFIDICAGRLIADGSVPHLEAMLEGDFPNVRVQDNADGSVTIHNIANDPRQNLADIAIPMIRRAIPAGISVSFPT